MTLGSLFDGIGGWLIAGRHAGIEPLWSSEIEPFPCAVTKHHFPDVVQLGDITKLDGAKLWPVDIICAGSPCQDLSVAGKQEGLQGERSGLFRDAIRLVRDMRRASGGQAPRFFVWENVPGAFSSNKGLDFRAVLEEITEAEIPMPADNKWADAGMVEWDGGSLAWRILDAQYWGVPQRRRRIFLVADFTGHSAGEILFECEGVRGDSSEGRKAGKGTAARTESGIGGTSGDCLTPWDCQAKRIYKDDGVFPCLQSTESNGEKPGSVYVPDKARSLTARNDGSPCVDRGPEIIAAGFKVGNSEAAHSIGYAVETSPTRSAMDSGNKPAVAIYDMTHADEVMRKVPDGRVPTLNARMGTGGNQVPVVSYAISGNTIDRQIQNGGNGKGVLKEKSYTLNTVDRHAVAAFREGSFGQYEKTDVAGTTKAVGGVLGGGSETFVCGGKTNATEGNKVLRVLREAYGEKKVCEWCSAILERIQSAKVLRQRVHEESISSETAQRDELDDDSLPCAEFVAKWLLRDLREREECGRTPQGRESAEQRDNELDEGVQELSHKTPPSAKEMCDLWRQAQGAWLLLQALAAFQEIRKPVNVKSWGPIKSVRRLTPLEAERLQGLPDGYTLIDDKTCSDTARYKALGNGMAAPCAEYVMRRIVEVCVA